MNKQLKQQLQITSPLKWLAIMPIFLLITIIGCNDGKKKYVSSEPVYSEATMLAVYIDRDGTKKIDGVLCVVQDNVKYDSVSGKKKIVSDSILGVPIMIPLRDSLKNVLKRVNGEDSLVRGWRRIGKDSVNFNVERVPLELLLKNK
jgi:hypothetical protein